MRKKLNQKKDLDVHMDIKKCRHTNTRNIFYHNSINEDGWICFCGEILGFRPDLDKKLIWSKVMGIMQDLHENKFIYFSNGSEGEGICEYLVNRCEEEKRYDQYFIIRELFVIKWKLHSDYWKQQSEIRDKVKKLRKDVEEGKIDLSKYEDMAENF